MDAGETVFVGGALCHCISREGPALTCRVCGHAGFLHTLLLFFAGLLAALGEVAFLGDSVGDVRAQSYRERGRRMARHENSVTAFREGPLLSQFLSGIKALGDQLRLFCRYVIRGPGGCGDHGSFLF
jgi:hypothetical protein